MQSQSYRVRRHFHTRCIMYFTMPTHQPPFFFSDQTNQTRESKLYQKTTQKYQNPPTETGCRYLFLVLVRVQKVLELLRVVSSIGAYPRQYSQKVGKPRIPSCLCLPLFAMMFSKVMRSSCLIDLLRLRFRLGALTLGKKQYRVYQKQKPKK